MAYDGTINEAAQLSTVTGITLARLQTVDAAEASLSLGGRRVSADIDPSVDPALLALALQQGRRVVVELGERPCVVGLLMTAPTLELDRQGNLRAQLRKLELIAEEAIIKTPKSFLMLTRQVAELCAGETVVRGRLLTRLLGKTIRIN